MQVTAQGLRSRIAQGKDSLDEPLKEVGSGTFEVDRLLRPSGLDNPVQVKPLGDQLLTTMKQKTTLETRLVADQKCGTFRRQREYPLLILRQQTHADQGIHHRSQSAL